LSEPPFIKHTVPAPYDFIPPVVADFNNDGRPDLPFLQNLGGFQFQARPEVGNLLRSVLTDTVSPQSLHGIAVADFDNDGQPDLIVAPYKSQWESQNIPILMLHNLGNWQFEFSNLPFLQNLLDYSPFQPWYSESIVAADLTGDGANDYFIPMYSWTNPFQSIFLHPTQTGLAEEAVARGLGLQGIPVEYDPEGVQAVDINQDGYLDLYAAHQLLINDGTGHFTDQAAAYGLPAVGDEGAVFVDYDNDGLLDLYIRTPDVEQQLWRNTGHGFVNDSVASGLACLTEGTSFYWGDVWADFNRDGYEDLLYMTGTHDAPVFMLLLNRGNGQFELGWTGNWLIDLAAVADFNGDGGLDVAGEGTVSENVIAPPPNNFDLVVTPEDGNGIRNQRGATILVTSQCAGTPAIQTRVTGDDSAYLAQSDYSSHFALNRQCQYQVKVTFPARSGQPPVTVTSALTPTIGPRLQRVVRDDGSVQDIDPVPFRFYAPIVGH